MLKNMADLTSSIPIPDFFAVCSVSMKWSEQKQNEVAIIWKLLYYETIVIHVIIRVSEAGNGSNRENKGDTVVLAAKE